jgi:tryptophanyl-tRNA synthetase
VGKRINAFLDPIRERRAHFTASMGLVRDALAAGTARARSQAQATMAMVRDALQLGDLDRFRGR